MSMNRRYGMWFSTPNTAAAEIAVDLGYGSAVLDIEHGSFDLAALDRFIPFLRALGMEVIAKVLSPERAPIQQALDFGADVVVIPHISGVEHAREVTAFSKFPPLGDRSYAGGRTTGYAGFDDQWVEQQDRRTRCFPMIEGRGAFNQLREILLLPTVDGVFIGPSDLSLRRGRGAYGRTEADFDDLAKIAAVAGETGKPWILPAWTSEERQFAAEHNADCVVLTMEHSAMMSGMRVPLVEMRERELDA